jgi:methyl-accepting chemotaxis protein
MSEWSISKRIAVLSTILVGALLLVTAMGITASLRLAGVSGDFKTAAADTLVIVRTAEDALEAQGFELRYRFDGDAEWAALAISNLEEITAMQSEIARLVSEDPAGQRHIANVVEESAEYRRLFESLQEIERERATAVEEAEGIETQLVTRLDSILSTARAAGDFGTFASASDAKTGLLSAVVAFEHFQLANDPSEFAEMEARVLAAQSQLTRLAGGPPGAITIAAADARDLLESYEAAASRTRDALAARIAQRGEIDALSADILARLNAALDVEVGQQEALSSANETILRSTVLLLAIVSLLAAAGSVVFALVSARGIRSAIEATVAQTQELANGNLDVEIVGAEKGHELGRMAQALEVFRTNALAAKEAQARQAEQERAQRLREEEQVRAQAAAEEASRREAQEARARMVAELRDSLGTVVDGAAAGDFSRRITARFAEEEFNRMAEGVNRLMSNVESGVKEVARVMSQVAAGDLTGRMSGNYAGLFAELQASVNETLATLTRVVEDIAAGCEAVTKQTSQMTEQSVELARRAEQQAASLEETSAAMEEISATARSSAEGAAQANAFASSATGRVDEAGRVVASAVGAMSDIRAASTRIGEIVSVIEGIAFQTNLLALNASVEAARAGSAGKGFAVVATEVRALAQRSSTASQDIKALIDESAAQVNRGVGLVEETGSTLKEIVEGVRKMAGSLGELVTAGREQAVGVQEVTTAIAQLDVITQKNAALADQSRELAGDLKTRAEAMEGLVATFRTGSGRRSSGKDGRGGAARIEDEWEAA